MRAFEAIQKTIESADAARGHVDFQSSQNSALEGAVAVNASLTVPNGTFTSPQILVTPASVDSPTGRSSARSSVVNPTLLTFQPWAITRPAIAPEPQLTSILRTFAKQVAIKGPETTFFGTVPTHRVFRPAPAFSTPDSTVGALASTSLKRPHKLISCGSKTDQPLLTQPRFSPKISAEARFTLHNPSPHHPNQQILVRPSTMNSVNSASTEYARAATHAGSWYSNSAKELSDQLDDWLSEVLTELPEDHARVIIAPSVPQNL